MWSFIRRIIQFVILAIATIEIAILITYSMKTIFEFDVSRRHEPTFNGRLKNTLTGSDDVPYEVLIVLNDNYVCSGALIDEKYVLTLASCVFKSVEENTYKKNMKVYVGTRTLPGGTPYNVEKITCHPTYNPISSKDDIAVVQLTRDGSKFDYAAPISLPGGDKTSYEGLELLVSSFVAPVRSPYAKYDQHKFLMLVVSNHRCKEFFPSIRDPAQFSGKFCAVTAPGYSACRGVTGSPATSEGTYIIGIYKEHKDCGAVYPELFIDVSTYLDFIKRVMA